MITFVNLFTIKPGQQGVAFERIQLIYTEVVRFQPGFIDATLLKSDDGSKVTAIAHWDKPERIAKLRQHPRFQELHDRVFHDAIAKVEPHIYSLAITVTSINQS